MPTALSAQTIEPVHGDDKLLSNYTTSWLANDGGYEESHIPHDMLNMYVAADGTLATICNWDEGGTNVAVFRDGKLLSRPEGSGTGGWGRFSGESVVLDEQYVYQLLTQHGCDGGNNELNLNGKRQFPPCDDAVEWKTIRRYDLKTGKGAPFPGGYGYRGDMLVVASERYRSLEGLAIDGNLLYVAIGGGKDHQSPDSIKIYDKRTMELQDGYPVQGGLGQIYADGRGALWMMQGRNIIRLDANRGKILPQRITLPEGVEASTCCIDTKRKRLLVPNHGKELNILVYDNIYKKPRLRGTFGQKGGVFAKDGKYREGEVGPLRFTGPRAVGVDDSGNIYIANTSVSGSRGSVIEAYCEKTAKQLWKQEGLIFTATADFDAMNEDLIYSPEKIHRVDRSIVGGRVDKALAYTANSFAFPDDERVKKDGAFITSTFKREIDGKSFLVVSDMYGGMLAGYRFDTDKHGYVGIPSFTFYNGNQSTADSTQCWMDSNGDGHRDEDEVRKWQEFSPYCMSFFIDHAGNVWRGCRERGFQLWKMLGLDENGNPQYAEPVLFPLPETFRDAKRIWYDAEADELFLGGNSNVNPDTRDTWWSMCGTLTRCQDFMKKAQKGEISEGWKADNNIYIPFHIEDGSGLDHTNAKAFTVAGDYVFVLLAREGWVTIYHRTTGKLVGRLQPGQVVHGQSGWADFNYAINAQKMPDGSYEILVEENAFAKVILYRWKQK